jgi:DNA polymerase III delta subunit
LRPVEFYALLEKGKAGAAYFLCGPDRFLHEECRAAVLGSLPAGTREWCFTEFEFKSGQLRRDLENAYQMPMLGGHSFLYWTDPEDFGHADEDDFEALEHYLKRPASFATVVFAAYQADRRRRFVQCLEKKTVVVDAQPPGRAEAAAWVRNYLRKSGVEMRPELADSIVSKFDAGAETSGRSKAKGVNLLWLRTELDKLLVACAGAQRIEESDLDFIVAVREEHEIGKMLAAIADRQLSKALTVLQELLAGKEPDALLLWCIGDLFRQALKSASSPGRQYRGWSRASNSFSTYEIAPRASRSYSREELTSAIRLVHGADLAIKSSWKDSRVLLETLLWQIMVGTAAQGSPAWLEELGQGAASGS